MKISYEIKQNKSNIFELSYIKDFLKITHDYEDMLLANLLNTSISYAEKLLRICITSSTIKANIEESHKNIILKYPSINSILSIILKTKEMIEEDITENFGTADYQINKITLADQFVGQNICFNYQTGFAPDNIPPQIKQAILLHLAKTYEQPANTSLIDKQIKELLIPYRIIKI
ncbi:MAG: phage gp6-like head-tail connector protein [Rickettsiaceae bacterium]|nr:phage gp6-like head-tail connector protein [Rickettsiaceae bacterium]